MMEEDDLEPAVRELTERIAVVRAAIDQEMAARARVEKRQEIVHDGPEQELEELREQLTEARTKVAKLNAAQPATCKSTARRGPYWIGAVVTVPGLIVVGHMVIDRIAHPEDALDPLYTLMFAAPLLLGLALLAQAHFGTYRLPPDDEGNFF
jgi:hypothetical protein